MTLCPTPRFFAACIIKCSMEMPTLSHDECVQAHDIVVPSRDNVICGKEYVTRRKTFLDHVPTVPLFRRIRMRVNDEIEYEAARMRIATSSRPTIIVHVALCCWRYLDAVA
ncbi:hypothetical protein E4U26_008255 [Claviceps purpurea]|nr:hypothetical protein E4U26_008255 [Claviceps purpurea]KAG6263500.1 hypothetical protein E4U49_002215 [Claviceps purpurea]